MAPGGGYLQGSWPVVFKSVTGMKRREKIPEALTTEATDSLFALQDVIGTTGEFWESLRMGWKCSIRADVLSFGLGVGNTH